MLYENWFPHMYADELVLGFYSYISGIWENIELLKKYINFQSGNLHPVSFHQKWKKCTKLTSLIYKLMNWFNSCFISTYFQEPLLR